MVKNTPRRIGLWTSTALVVGNLIGSGIFLLPAALAAYGGISLLGWIASSFGALALALLFSNLSKLIPGVSGGPYLYTQRGLGDFAGFLVAWGYWISIWCTNAAIAVTFVSYLTVFFPSLATHPQYAVATGWSAVWLLTWVNTRGVRTAGLVQLLTTIFKLVPLILVSFVGLFYIDVKNFLPFNVSGRSDFSAVTATATLTLFAYLGVECATIPAGDIQTPAKTIPRATLIGTAITILVYILGSVTVMGLIPPATLQQSNAPFADAAALIWGEQARTWVALGAIVSTFGALNGWILMQGQIPLAASRDKLFPRIFGRENKMGAPGIGVIISSLLITLLMTMNFTKGLQETFTFMLLLSTVTCLVPYLFSAAAQGVLIVQEKGWKGGKSLPLVVAATAFLYSLWAVVGSGQEAVYWGFFGILCGIPLYVWMKNVGDPNEKK